MFGQALVPYADSGYLGRSFSRQDDTGICIRQNNKTAKNPHDTDPSGAGLWAILENLPDNY